MENPCESEESIIRNPLKSCCCNFYNPFNYGSDRVIEKNSYSQEKLNYAVEHNLRPYVQVPVSPLQYGYNFNPSHPEYLNSSNDFAHYPCYGDQLDYAGHSVYGQNPCYAYHSPYEYHPTCAYPSSYMYHPNHVYNQDHSYHHHGASCALALQNYSHNGNSKLNQEIPSEFDTNVTNSLNSLGSSKHCKNFQQAVEGIQPDDGYSLCESNPPISNEDEISYRLNTNENDCSNQNFNSHSENKATRCVDNNFDKSQYNKAILISELEKCCGLDRRQWSAYIKKPDVHLFSKFKYRFPINNVPRHKSYEVLMREVNSDANPSHNNYPLKQKKRERKYLLGKPQHFKFWNNLVDSSPKKPEFLSSKVDSHGYSESHLETGQMNQKNLISPVQREHGHENFVNNRVLSNSKNLIYTNEISSQKGEFKNDCGRSAPINDLVEKMEPDGIDHLESCMKCCLELHDHADKYEKLAEKIEIHQKLRSEAQNIFQN